MRYIEDISECQLHTKLVSNETLNTTPENLENKLVPVSDRIEGSYKSNRAMWPEEELQGVSITDEDGFKGEIQPKKIEIVVDNYKDFDKAYSAFSGWLSAAGFSIPSKQSFHVESFSFMADNEDTYVHYDDSKVTRKHEMLGSIYQSDDITSSFTYIQGMVSFSIIDSDADLPIERFEQYIQQIISDQILLVGDKEDADLDELL